MDEIVYQTSESVTEGHPDKIADFISDSVVDALLEEDSESKVACETLVSTNLVVLSGEITTSEKLNDQFYRDLVEDVIDNSGYGVEDKFSSKDLEFRNYLHEQSSDILQGVNREDPQEQGAGDQGITYGYACNENSAFLPSSIYYAHKMTRELAKLRKEGSIKWLKPDGKCQITVKFSGSKIQSIPAVVLASQHKETMSDEEEIKSTLKEMVIDPIIGQFTTDKTRIVINGTGRFVNGGPNSDTGLTGRKIIVDTYGGVGSHGGGCFSGKDPSKIDRSASYFARCISKNIVRKGWASECEIQLAYAIGESQPVSVNINTFDTETIEKKELHSKVSELDLTPYSMIKQLDLKRPIYKKTSNYGHFGRDDPDFLWESLKLF